MRTTQPPNLQSSSLSPPPPSLPHTSPKRLDDDDDEPEPKKDGTEKIESNEAEEEMEEEDEYDKFGKLIDKDPTILAHGAWYVVLFSQSRPCTASMPAVFLYSIITQVGASCPN